MCTVIAWAGYVPQSLLTNLLISAESRGKDSTGIAFRDSQNAQSVTYRRASTAKVFTKNNQKCIGEARRSPIGIAHTRRASRDMPIDNINAHPFVYGKYIFAHNGSITNWKTLQASLPEGIEDPAQREFVASATTDSMVLGPCIAERDFAPAKGCMGLVWMKHTDVYCMHAAKELEAVTLTWHHAKDAIVNPETDRVLAANPARLTLVASTAKIIMDALYKLPTSIMFVTAPATTLEEATVYKITDTGCISEGKVPVNADVAPDAFTSTTDVKVGETFALPAPAPASTGTGVTT